MVNFLWGLSILLTLMGALLYWGAGVLRMSGFYRGAGFILSAALGCAGLAQAGTRWAAWLGLGG